MRQAGDEADGVGEDRRTPARQLQAAHGGIEGGEQHVLGDDVRMGETVEQRRLAGVGVAHQRHRRIRHSLAGRALQCPRPTYFLELVLQLADLLGDQPTVCLDLGFAGAAHDPEAATLAFQVGPGADQTRLLVREPRELDLQPAFAGSGAAGEDLQDQAGAVDDLHLPGLLQIALLHGRQRIVDDGDAGVGQFDHVADLDDLARPEEGGRRQPAKWRDDPLADLKVEGQRQADGFFQARVGAPGRGLRIPVRVDDDGALDRRRVIDEFA